MKYFILSMLLSVALIAGCVRSGAYHEEYSGPKVTSGFTGEGKTEFYNYTSTKSGQKYVLQYDEKTGKYRVVGMEGSK